MFENFVISEVKKCIEYESLDWKINYWRSTSGSEVDLVLSSSTKVIGVEIKHKSGKVTTAFTSRYPDAKKHLVTINNLL